MVGRDELMALLSRALREHLPEAAEERLREIERVTSTTPELAAAPGPRADDIALAMNRIERETPGGPRGAWTVLGGARVSVRAEQSRESLKRNLDQLLTPLVKQGLPPEAAAALPALQPLLIAMRGATPGQSPLDVLTSVLSGIGAPPSSSSSALTDAEAALKACFPQRAEELLTALRRRMPQFAPPLDRVEEHLAGAHAEGLALAEAAASLATRIEDRQTGGARYRWTARQRGVALEILREPLG